MPKKKMKKEKKSKRIILEIPAEAEDKIAEAISYLNGVEKGDNPQGTIRFYLYKVLGNVVDHYNQNKNMLNTFESGKIRR